MKNKEQPNRVFSEEKIIALLANKFYPLFYTQFESYDATTITQSEDLNIFNILRLKTAEISHSRFIGWLLNPKGSHKQGDAFLKLFVDIFYIENFETKNATLYLEKEIPDGGRIDILIQDTNNVYIAIENKIDAEDQDSQLLRYHNFIKEQNKNSRLLYLTIYGEEASYKSTGNYIDYEQISYTRISRWLDKCSKKIKNFVFLNELINQYSVMVSELIKDPNPEFTIEIADAILENEEMNAAYNFLLTDKEMKNKILAFSKKKERLYRGKNIMFNLLEENDKLIKAYEAIKEAIHVRKLIKQREQKK